MPDQELLDDVLEGLEQSGSPVKNPVLRQALIHMRHPGQTAPTFRTAEL